MGEPQTVLLLERYGVRGGAQVVLCDLVYNLDRDRFRPIVACLAPGEMVDDLRSRGIITHVVPIGKIRTLSQLASAVRQATRLAAECRREKVRLVHINQLGGRLPIVFGEVLARMLRTPSVWHVHNPPDGLTSRKARIFFRLVSHLQPAWTIFANPLSMQTYAGFYAQTRCHSLILPGIPQLNPEQGNGISPRQEFGIGDDIPVVAMVARVTELKAQHELVEAIAELAHRDIHVHALICGGLGPPEYLDRLTRLAAQLGIADRITFTGHIEGAPKSAIVDCCDIYVHTATFESLGLAVLEAMAAGTPVIAADAPGPSFIIRPEENGLLYRRGDLIALADNIESLIRNPQKRDSLGRAARLRAAEFSIEAMVESVQDVWRSLLDVGPMVDHPNCLHSGDSIRHHAHHSQ